MHRSVETVLLAYKQGVFPMATSANSDELHWISPEKRGVIPIGKLHVSRSLKKFIRKHNLKASTNFCFNEVLQNCSDRQDTWINSELKKLYLELNKKGHALSVEVWLDNELIGGLLGLTIGSCFIGETMFSSSQNGSKLALICTMARLVYNNFLLFDTQFLTKHLSSMGGCEISRQEYISLLNISISKNSNFFNFSTSYSWSDMIHLSSQNL